MKIHPTILLITMLLVVTSSYSQTPVLSANQIYGLNPELYNGKIYSYAPAITTKGTQFLYGPEFEKGSVVINGKTFGNLLLNYDVFNQQVVLKFMTRMNNMMKIILSDVWLKSFNLGDKHFEILSFPKIKPRIYQVIGKGRYEVLYTWRKDYNLQNTYGASNYAFSKPVRESYLKFKDKLTHYKNNKQFVNLFSSENRPLLNKFLRKNKIKVKKSGSKEILQLINYCNTLPTK